MRFPLTYLIYSIFLVTLSACASSSREGAPSGSPLLELLSSNATDMELHDERPSWSWSPHASSSRGGRVLWLQSNGNESFLTVSNSSEVQLRDLAGRALVLWSGNGYEDGAEEVTQTLIVGLSPLGRYLAAARGRSFRVIDLRLQQEVVSLNLPVRVSALSFAEDGCSVYLGGADGFVYRWKGIESSQLEKYAGHPTIISSLATVPGTKLWISGDWDGSFLVWVPYDHDPLEGEYRRSVLAGDVFVDSANSVVGMRGKGVALDHLQVDEQGKRILIAYQDGNVDVWSRRGLRRESAVPAHPGALSDIRWHPDGQSFVSLGKDGTLRSWSLESHYSDLRERDELKIERQLEIENTGFRKIVFDSASRLLAAGDTGGVFEIDLRGLQGLRGEKAPTESEGK